MAARRALLAAGALFAVGGLVLGAVRVIAHERGELEHRAGPARIADLRRTDPNATDQTVRFTEVELARGDRVLVELCAATRAPDATWEGALHVVAWIPDGETLLFRTPLGGARGVRRIAHGPGAGRRCWTVGILTMPRRGRVAIELFWPGRSPAEAVARTPLDLRVAAYALPTPVDRVAVALLGLGVLLAVVGLGLGAGPAAEAVRGPAPDGGPLVALAAVALLAAATFASGLVAGGATGLLASGLLLALAQVGIALALSRRPPATPWLDRLAIRRASWRGVGGAVLVALAAGAVALWVPALLPARGVAPLEVAIAWPSGKLAVGLVALLVPVAEELFFRGLVLGALRPRLGAAGAVVAASVIFLAAHVPQDLGNPGALVAVGLTGLLLGGLRVLSGTLWPAILAHVLYNAALVTAAWLP